MASSPDVAMSGDDNPVLGDQGTSTEVEAIGLLRKKKIERVMLAITRPLLKDIPLKTNNITSRTILDHVFVSSEQLIVSTILSKKRKNLLYQRVALTGTHLQGHLPGPGVGHGLLAVDDAGIAGHLGRNGRGAAAWRK